MKAKRPSGSKTFLSLFCFTLAACLGNASQKTVKQSDFYQSENEVLHIAHEGGIVTEGQITLSSGSHNKLTSAAPDQIELSAGVSIVFDNPDKSGSFEATVVANYDDFENNYLAPATTYRFSDEDRTGSPNPKSSGFFASSIAVDKIKDRMIVRDTDQAYVLERMNGKWSEPQALDVIASSPIGEYNGQTVAITAGLDENDAWAFIGDPLSGSGKVHVYRLQADETWAKSDILIPEFDSLPGGNFGHSLAVHKRRLVVGAYSATDPLHPERGKGRAFIYRLSGDTWEFEAELSFDYQSSPLPAALVSENLGRSVDIHYEHVALSESERSDTTQEPQSQTYRSSQDLETPWNPAKTITHPFPQSSSSGFGWRLGISGNWLAISAPFFDGVKPSEGIVYLFAFDEVNETWELDEAVLCPTPESQLSFGYDIDLHGDRLVATTLNANKSYVYRFDEYSTRDRRWKLDHVLDLESDGINGSKRVALGTDFIVVSSPSEDEGGLSKAGGLYTRELLIPDASSHTPGEAPTPPLPPRNLAPIALDDFVSISSAQSSIAGNLLSNDVDLDILQVHSLSEGPVNSAISMKYGEIIVTSGGDFVYTLHQNHSDIVALGEDETLFESALFYLASDGALNSPFDAKLTIQIARSPNQMHHYIVADDSGTLSFPQDPVGHRIPDWSYSGYQYQGADAIPQLGLDYHIVAVVDELVPQGAAAFRNTYHIQSTIDAVEALPLSSKGFRGAIQFTQNGSFPIDDEVPIRIEESGIVLLLGDVELENFGDPIDLDPDPSRYEPSYQTHEQIIVGKQGIGNITDKWEYYNAGIDGPRYDIIDSFVPVGARSFRVANIDGLEVGADYIISHDPTPEWMTAINDGGFVPEPKTADEWPLEYKYYDIGDPGPTHDTELGPVNIRYWRTITDLDPSTNTVTIDAPIFYAMDNALVDPYLFKYTETVIENVGIEGGRIDLDEHWNDEPRHNETNGRAIDSSKGVGIDFVNVRHGWIRGTYIENYRISGFHTTMSRNISVVDVSCVNPHSEIVATRMYGFNNDGGQMIFHENCYSSFNRHNYMANGWGADSGNVYLNCISDNNYGQSEYGHQRFTHGGLFDNMIFRQTGRPAFAIPRKSFSYKLLWLGNHELSSRGHGIASMNSLVWRGEDQARDQTFILVQVSPTGLSWEYFFDGVATDLHEHAGELDLPIGYWPGLPGQGVDASYLGEMPLSLYEAQLAQRLGTD